MRNVAVGLLCLGILISPASAGIIVYTASLTGSAVVPSNPSTATGFDTVTVDTVANTLMVSESWTGLLGGAAVSGQIHCCTPSGNTGVAIVLTSFPSATAGTYSNTFDLTNTVTYDPPFLSASGGTAALAEAALLAGLAADDAYSDIHDGVYAGGEIRGNLAPSTVPEPGTLALAGGGLLLGLLRRRRR